MFTLTADQRKRFNKNRRLWAIVGGVIVGGYTVKFVTWQLFSDDFKKHDKKKQSVLRQANEDFERGPRKYRIPPEFLEGLQFDPSDPLFRNRDP